MAAPVITICDKDSDVADKLCEFVIQKANELISTNDAFYVGLSGNSHVYLVFAISKTLTKMIKVRTFVPRHIRPNIFMHISQIF